MVSRKAENINLTSFKLGSLYSKKEIAELGGISPPENPYDFGGFTALQNSVLVFINLERKDPLPHQSRIFENQLEGEMVYTDSQPSNTMMTPIIKRISDPAEDVRLFTRLKPKMNGKVQPFCYLGRIQCVDQYGSEPVRLHWKLLDYLQLFQNPNYQLLTGDKPFSSRPSKNEDSIKLSQGAIPPQISSFSEGAKQVVTGNRYERDTIARSICIKHHGTICWVCGFDFQTCYGSLGGGFIIVHHRIPIAIRAKEGKYELDPVRDLVPLCANCHAMVHRKMSLKMIQPGEILSDQWLRLTELRSVASLDDWESIE